MSDDYTPTTEQVRDAYAPTHLGSWEYRRAEFARWLAHHDADLLLEYEKNRGARMRIENIDGEKAEVWLAAHDAEVRADQQEKDAQIVDLAVRTLQDATAGQHLSDADEFNLNEALGMLARLAAAIRGGAS